MRVWTACFALLLGLGCGSERNGRAPATHVEDEDSTPQLASGTYALSNGGLVVDECNFGFSWYQGIPEAIVTAAPDRIAVDFWDLVFEYEVTGTTLRDPLSGSTTLDFSDEATALENGLSQPYDCHASFTWLYGGEVLGAGAFVLEDTYDIDATGPGCIAMANELGVESVEELFGVTVLPCRTIDTVSAALR